MKFGKRILELKVVASTVVALLLGGLTSYLNAAQADGDLLGDMPSWAQTVVLMAGPTLVTLITGYQTKHTARPDLAAPSPDSST